MKPSKRVQKVIIFVATLLLLCELSAAQKPNPNDWGKAVDGLQMSIYRDQVEGRQSEFSKFRVELRNGGQHDLFLNLGIMNRNGGHQYPNAVSLILEDAQGNPQRLELKKSFQVSDAGKAVLFLPLPVGATFSFPVDLDNYWAPTSKEFDSRLNSGTYWLAAQFTGSIGTDNHVIFIAGGPNQPANMVSLEPGLGAATPISNTLQFEIPSR